MCIYILQMAKWSAHLSCKPGLKKINLPVNTRDTNVMFLLNIWNINECLNIQFKVEEIKEATKTCHWSNMCLLIPWGSVWCIMGFLWSHITKGAKCLFTCKLMYSRGKRMQMLSNFFFSIDKSALSIIVEQGKVHNDVKHSFPET